MVVRHKFSQSDKHERAIMNSKRSLKAKLITASLIMVAIFMVIGAIAIISLVKVSDHYRHVAQINLNNTKLLAEMNHASAEVTRNYLGHVR